MRTFPTARIDALTDGIFAFAMTLLVLEIKLPDGLPIHDGAALIAHLKTLEQEYLTYIVSFFVLATQWRGTIELRRVEEVSQNVLGGVMVYLLFITSVPFSSSVVGHYGDLAPAVWLYGANMIAVSLLSLMVRRAVILPEHQAAARIGHTRALFFMATAVGSILVSFVEPGYAMYVYLINIVTGPIAERLYSRPA
jgi:uncharacterized membrane protein